MIRKTAIPALQVDGDAFSVVTEVRAGNFKILPGDEAKIGKAIEIVRDRVDLAAILDGLRT
jgi:hypothetical protein